MVVWRVGMLDAMRDATWDRRRAGLWVVQKDTLWGSRWAARRVGVMAAR